MPNKRMRWVFLTTSVGLGLALAILLIHPATPAFSFSPSPAFAAFAQNQTQIADVAERVLPSVVNIASTRRVKVGRRAPFHPFFGGPRQPHQQLQRGQGSGVIISSDGYVVTNNHVVKGATEVKVTLHDKRRYDATVVGTDPKSDLAVLRLKGAKNLRPLPFGSSTKLRLGDIVLAVGNPFGIGQTVTMGIVSAKGRSNMGIVDYEDFIQTDAAINPGNSGGALVNLKGELIGINTAILSRSGGYQGIGFAIPSKMAQPIVNSLRRSGKVVRGYLGVMIQDTTPELSKAMGLPSTAGVLISDVVPGGPAHKAGVRRGDFVTRINGQAVDSSARLRNLVAGSGSGKTLAISLWRKGKTLTITATSGTLPTKVAAGAFNPRRSPGQPALRSGLEIAPLSPTMRRRHNIPTKVRRGVVISSIKPGSKAAQVGLRRGDVILEANQVKITNVRRFSNLYAASKGSVLTLVYRQGSTFFVLLPK
ncbi:MAG: DegQ family serine endoprotease [Deltaproteobacteria bacterium]|nr:DegQ family serine endoprotease [Deltaproteobacteria bacterium]